MKKLYYEIMTSSIYTAQNNGFMSEIWKFASSFYFAFASSIYLLFLFILFNNYIFNHNLDFFYLKFIDGNYNFILNMVLYFIIPIMTINYFNFLKNNKYKIMFKKYDYCLSKKRFAWFFMIGFVFMFATLFLKK